MKALVLAILLGLALVGCDKEVCVETGQVSVPDYYYMPIYNGSTFTQVPIYLGSHLELGCLRWEKVAEEAK